MTAVSGHLTQARFDDEYEQNWDHPPPESLFNAPVRVKVDDVLLVQLADDANAADM